MYRIAICDDCRQDQEKLRRMIHQTLRDKPVCPYQIVVMESGEKLLSLVMDAPDYFDLIFLDIYMAGMNGMEAAKKLRELGCRSALIFLTTSPDFALESYDVEAAGYLLKPPAPEAVEKALNKHMEEKPRKKIRVLAGREKRYLYQNDILYAESRNHDIIICLSSGERLQVREKLSDFEAELADKRFLRCHKSFLINMDAVKDVKEGFVLKNGETIPIRARDKAAIAEAYYQYFVSHTVKTWRG